MDSLPEFVGTVHIFLGPYRGNPIALYMRRDETTCHISPRMYPWNRTVGSGETPNKAAAAFEAKWKENDLSAEMYSGPHWEGGIKPEKPKPPPKPAAPKPAATAPAGAAKPNAPAAKPTEGQPTPAPAAAKEEAPSPSVAKPPAATDGTPHPSASSPQASEAVKASETAPTPSPEKKEL